MAPMTYSIEAYGRRFLAVTPEVVANHVRAFEDDMNLPRKGHRIKPTRVN